MVDSVFLEGAGCECDVTLDTWLKDSLPMLPGIERGLASRELVLAAREFFERTFAWQAYVEHINAKAGEKVYWQSPYDQYSNTIGILGVTWKGNALAPMPYRPASMGGETTPTSDTPSHYYAAYAPDSFYLYPQLTNDVDDAIGVYLALTPKQSVEHLPRIAAIKFYDAILEGFLARVFRHPNKPYSAPETAMRHRKSFIMQCGRFKGQANQGYVQAQNWAFPGGWRVR